MIDEVRQSFPITATEVKPAVPAPAPGEYRAATPDDLEQLLDWWRAFIVEALPHEEVGPRDRSVIERRTFGLWEDGGRAVALPISLTLR